jgi:hypothetical protein
MKPIQTIVSKGKCPKMRNMPPKKKVTETPNEDFPHMQLRLSTRNGKENKSGKATSMYPSTLDMPQRYLTCNHSEEDQKTPIKQQPNNLVTRMRGKFGPSSRNKN